LRRASRTLRLFAGPAFASTAVWSSSALADGMVIAVAPQAVAVGYAGSPTIETFKETAFHFEDSAPAHISTTGTPNTIAAPTRSVFQSDLIAIKTRAMRLGRCSRRRAIHRKCRLVNSMSDHDRAERVRTHFETRRAKMLKGLNLLHAAASIGIRCLHACYRLLNSRIIGGPRETSVPRAVRPCPRGSRAPPAPRRTRSGRCR
jgi:hypothetical protein